MFCVETNIYTSHIIRKKKTAVAATFFYAALKAE